MNTTITDQKQAETVEKQLAHVRGKVTDLAADLDTLRNQITSALMSGKSTVDLLSKRSRIDSDLQAHRQSERDLSIALADWQARQTQEDAAAARRDLERITAEAREVEAQYVTVMASAHAILDRIDELRIEHFQARIRAKQTGGLALDFGGAIIPEPAYPRANRRRKRRMKDPAPSYVPKPQIGYSYDDLALLRTDGKAA